MTRASLPALAWSRSRTAPAVSTTIHLSNSAKKPSEFLLCLSSCSTDQFEGVNGPHRLEPVGPGAHPRERDPSRLLQFTIRKGELS